MSYSQTTHSTYNLVVSRFNRPQPDSLPESPHWMEAALGEKATPSLHIRNGWQCLKNDHKTFTFSWLCKAKHTGINLLSPLYSFCFQLAPLSSWETRSEVTWSGGKKGLGRARMFLQLGEILLSLSNVIWNEKASVLIRLFKVKGPRLWLWEGGWRSANCSGWCHVLDLSPFWCACLETCLLFALLPLLRRTPSRRRVSELAELYFFPKCAPPYRPDSKERITLKPP